jgi:hypothetical protein
MKRGAVVGGRGSEMRGRGGRIPRRPPGKDAAWGHAAHTAAHTDAHTDT